MTQTNENPEAAEVAIVAARRHRGKTNFDEPVTLSTGIRARIKGVPPAIIDDATTGLKDPKIPTTFDEEKGREVENPFDPEYLSAKEEVERQRGVAAMDVMIMFGVDLVDPIPDDDTWLSKLRFLARRKTIPFDETLYNLEDPVEREFIFKRYVAVAGADLALISERSGIVNQGALQQAENTF